MDYALKLSFTDSEFYINETKQTTTCRLHAYCDMVGYMTAVATTRCSNGDVYDVKKGKQIALAKAENKLYKMARREISLHRAKAEDIVKSCSAFVNKATRCILHNEGYIESIHNPK